MAQAVCGRGGCGDAARLPVHVGARVLTDGSPNAVVNRPLLATTHVSVWPPSLKPAVALEASMSQNSWMQPLSQCPQSVQLVIPFIILGE